MADNRLASDRSGSLFTLISVACLAIVGGALYLQHVKDLEPCPWCIVQRLGFLLIALIALVGALARPSGGGVTVFAGLGGLVAAAGIAAAGYHIYLQSDEARANACVGSVVEKLLDTSRIGKWIPPLLQYDGPCTLKPWALLGLSIPEWSLVGFVVMLLALIAVPFIVRR